MNLQDKYKFEWKKTEEDYEQLFINGATNPAMQVTQTGVDGVMLKSFLADYLFTVQKPSLEEAKAMGEGFVVGVSIPPQTILGTEIFAMQEDDVSGTSDK